MIETCSQLRVVQETHCGIRIGALVAYKQEICIDHMEKVRRRISLPVKRNRLWRYSYGAKGQVKLDLRQQEPESSHSKI